MQHRYKFKCLMLLFLPTPNFVQESFSLPGSKSAAAIEIRVRAVAAACQDGFDLHATDLSAAHSFPSSSSGEYFLTWMKSSQLV